MRAGKQHTPAAARNPSPRMMGGTPGGLFGALPGASLVPQGDALYLWALIALEVLAIGWLRASFKRYHGG